MKLFANSSVTIISEKSATFEMCMFHITNVINDVLKFASCRRLLHSNNLQCLKIRETSFWIIKFHLIKIKIRTHTLKLENMFALVVFLFEKTQFDRMDFYVTMIQIEFLIRFNSIHSNSQEIITLNTFETWGVKGGYK